MEAHPTANKHFILIATQNEMRFIRSMVGGSPCNVVRSSIDQMMHVDEGTLQQLAHTTNSVMSEALTRAGVAWKDGGAK